MVKIISAQNYAGVDTITVWQAFAVVRVNQKALWNQVLYLANSDVEEYNRKQSPAHLRKEVTYTVIWIITFIKRLTGVCFQSLHHRFVVWTKPGPTSLMLGTLTDLARSKSELVAENAFLRQQLIIIRRQVKRPACTKTDRMLLVLLAKMARNWQQALFIVQPETLLRWHRHGFKLYWKHKSRATSAKPKISAEIISLIKEMARDNRLWGAERIRGELLKLGIRVCKRTIQKYMRQVRITRPYGVHGQKSRELDKKVVNYNTKVVNHLFPL